MFGISNVQIIYIVDKATESIRENVAKKNFSIRIKNVNVFQFFKYCDT